MKILFVCQQYIHAARWVNLLKDSHHEIYVFDCLDKPIHKDLLWTNYFENWSKRKIPYIKGEYRLEKKMPEFFNKIEPFFKVTASEKLEEIIRNIQPDLVHSLEMQSQTYPLLKVRKKRVFNWAYFSWGSDIFLYKNEKVHFKKMKNVFSKLNYLFVDNNRDIFLTKKLGFNNEISGVFPGGGGYDLCKFKTTTTSILDRKLILIKGYHHWAGRALHVLESIELIIDEIKHFEIYVYSAHDVVVKKIEELNNKYNLTIKYSSRYNQISHEELLVKFGSAKIAIGNNISDGIPNTLLEAIISGAFPIQSNPGGATEDYIIHGENGFLIENPENVYEIANLIKESIVNNDLVSKAYKINQEKAKNLEYSKIKKEVLKVYKKIENSL